MNYIKRAIHNFKEVEPKTTNKDIAEMLFPNISIYSAEQKLSTWINDKNLDNVKVSHAIKMCEIFKITPNELLKDYEQFND